MPAPRSSPVAREPSTCPACSTVNPPGMNFCKMCGTALAPRMPTPIAAPVVAARSAVAPAPAVGPLAQAASAPSPMPLTPSGKVMRPCSSCGKPTPAGFNFCQHCGQRLSPARAIEPAPAEVAGMATIVSPTPAAGVLALQPGGETARTALVAEAAEAPVAMDPLATPFGRLVAIGSDGRDGAVHSLTGTTFDLGRSEGGVTFPSDALLAARHARFWPAGGAVHVKSLDTVNGIFLRLQAPTELTSGDMILLGKEIFRFEWLSPEEVDAPQLVEHGVRFLGSVPRESWARLRQLTRAATTRDVWHLSRNEFVLGREEGDATFPDDEFISRVHALIRRVGDKARLEDMGSSNGTFLRLRGEQGLRGGETLRLGDQLLRFER